MSTIQHADLTSIHPFAHISDTDPGAVGAGKGWIDTSTTNYNLYIRDESNTSWILVSDSSGGGGDTSLGWLNIRDYGAVGNAKRVDNGAIPSIGSHTFTSATAGFVLADVGKKITVEGAGAAGAILSTTISGYTNSTTVTLTAAASTAVTGATTWFGTDDTAAIQAAIDDWYANYEVGTIYCPAGTYLLNGSLQGTVGSSSAFSRIRFPANDAGVSGKWPSVKLLGCAPPAFQFGSGIPGITVLPNKGTVFVSTEDGGTVVGIEPTAGNNFSLMRVDIENIIVRTKDNPTQGGIDMRLASQWSLRNVQIDTGLYSMNCSQPTHTSVVGAYTPALNNGASTKTELVSVSGYYTGIYNCEHGSGDNIYATACYYGHRFTSGTGHSQNYGRVVAHNCVYPLAFDSNVALTIQDFVSETPIVGWQQTVAHIHDSSGTNAGRPTGTIGFTATKVGTGFINLIFDVNATVSGLQFTNLRSPGGVAILYATGSSQSLTSGTPANVNWMTIDANYDYASVVSWSSGTNPEQITVKYPGLYSLRAAVAFAASATGQRLVYISINNVVQINGPWFSVPTSGSGIATAEDSYYLQAGDIIRVGALQSSGGALLIDDLGGSHPATRLSISKLK